MEIVLVGSRWFGEQVFLMLREKGHEVFVVAPSESDRLAMTAATTGSRLVVPEKRRVTEAHVPGTFDLLIAAHSHSFVTTEARAKAQLGAIGYHPSLLPRHRGIAAVEWTIRSGDPIAGGSIYHLSEGMDAGAIAAQDWCFVFPGEGPQDLWRRALAPLGLKLLARVVDEYAATGTTAAVPQIAEAVTYAPLLKGG